MAGRTDCTDASSESRARFFLSDVGFLRVFAHGDRVGESREEFGKECLRAAGRGLE